MFLTSITILQFCLAHAINVVNYLTILLFNFFSNPNIIFKQEVANELEVQRIGPQHQAGSDSLLTGLTFFRYASLK